MREPFLFFRSKSLFFVSILSAIILLLSGSCSKSNDTEKEVNNKGIIAGKPDEVISQLAKNYTADKDIEYLLAPSINYADFYEYFKNLCACGSIIVNNFVSDPDQYRKYLGNDKILPDNQFLFMVSAVKQINGKFYTCSSGIIIVEKNKKTNKYYIIAYSMISN